MFTGKVDIAAGILFLALVKPYRTVLIFLRDFVPGNCAVATGHMETIQ